MRLEWERDDKAQVYRLRAEWTFEDLIDAPLDAIDRQQLAAPQQSMADVLLDAELITRRIEQSKTDSGK